VTTTGSVKAAQLHLVHLPAQFAQRQGLQRLGCKGTALAQHGLGGKTAHGHDHFGLQQRHLTQQVRRALRDFARLGVAVLRWPALDDVGDVHLLGACQPHGRQHAVEQLAGPPDKRQALAVLFFARRFAHDQPVG
jgi:hypothetical protein